MPVICLTTEKSRTIPTKLRNGVTPNVPIIQIAIQQVVPFHVSITKKLSTRWKKPMTFVKRVRREDTVTKKGWVPAKYAPLERTKTKLIRPPAKVYHEDTKPINTEPNTILVPEAPLQTGIEPNNEMSILTTI